MIDTSKSPAVGRSRLSHAANRTFPYHFTAFATIRVLLGSVLLAAAVLKAYGLTTGYAAEVDLFTPRWLRINVVVFEWSFGMWLLSGLHPKPTWKLALACFSAFACVAFYRAIVGHTSCGCFGGVRLNPWYTLAFDLAAVAMLMRSRPAEASGPTIRSRPFRAACLLTITFWAGGPWAVLMAQHEDSLESVALEPETWAGERFPLLDRIDIGDRVAEGRWTIVLYHHDCSACQEAIPEYERRAREAARPGSSRIALIEMPPYGKPGEGPVATRSPCILGRLDDSRRWIVDTPAEVLLQDGVVMPSDRRLR